MTKKDIVLKISDMTGIKQVDVKKIVQKTFDVIVESLVRNEKVELRNFGVFKIKERRPKCNKPGDRILKEMTEVRCWIDDMLAQGSGNEQSHTFC